MLDDIIKSIMDNDFTKFKQFYDTPIDIETPLDPAENRAIHYACLLDRLEFVSYLIRKGADIYYRSPIGMPLEIACTSATLSVFKHIMESKVVSPSITLENDSTLLHLASKNKKTSAILVYLIQVKNLPLNKQDKFGNTPIQVACKAGILDNVKVLVEAGADIHPSCIEKASGPVWWTNVNTVNINNYLRSLHTVNILDQLETVNEIKESMIKTNQVMDTRSNTLVDIEKTDNPYKLKSYLKRIPNDQELQEQFHLFRQTYYKIHQGARGGRYILFMNKKQYIT